MLLFFIWMQKLRWSTPFNVKSFFKTQIKGENWQAVQTQKVFWCSLPKVLQRYLTSTPLFLIQNFKCRFSAQLIYDELTTVEFVKWEFECPWESSPTSSIDRSLRICLANLSEKNVLTVDVSKSFFYQKSCNKYYTRLKI